MLPIAETLDPVGYQKRFPGTSHITNTNTTHKHPFLLICCCYFAVAMNSLCSQSIIESGLFKKKRPTPWKNQ
jgi:hypothetical protein